MLKRTSASLALIFCASYAFAQEAYPTVSGTAPTDAGASAAVVSGTQSANISGSEADSEDASEGFALPGGYGSTPLNFIPGQGHFDRPPVQFSTTIQHGYDDNIYTSNNAPGQQPKHGSMISYLTEGVDLLFAQSRTAFSLSANGGVQYYWDNNNTDLLPTGNINLLYAYKITPQTQLSVQLSASYLTQPAFSILQGLTDSNSKGYFIGNAKVDLQHRWTPRFSTDTTYLAYGTYYSDSAFKNSNYINNTIGQSFNYIFSRVVTGILEARASQVNYDGSGTNNQSYYGLVGTDLTITRRLSSSIRLGSQTRIPDSGGSLTTPYAEGSVSYVLTRTTLLAWQNRYGYDDNGSSNSAARSFRSGLSVTQNITPKLRGNLGVNFTEADALIDNNVTINNSYSAVSCNAGLSYAVTKKLSVFANYNRIDKLSPSDYVKYSKNIYYLGASLQY